MRPAPFFILLALATLILGACSAPGADGPSAPATLPPPRAETVTRPPDNAPPPAAETLPAQPAAADLARSDAQGMVEFVVTPLNLNAPAETLDFDVSMDTHSVNVGWDLAALSTLSTDAGLAVQGVSWPVGGGQHYEGTLTFPAKTAGGRALLEGAKTVTLAIREAGAPERMFMWELSW
ncbi:MAG: hypothetical protein HY784_02745 [Chloroflexi bacterium]|nr:hypothetical protein [Chloroflexota bacterium]